MIRRIFSITMLLLMLLVLSGLIVTVDAINVEPTVVETRKDIWGYIPPNDYDRYDLSYTDWVYVKLTYVGNNRQLTVVIKVDGLVKWSGGLTTGESSPTIPTHGQTIVLIRNDNDERVYYEGYMSIYYW